MPGGVSSPVRAFDPYPIFIAEAKGSKLIDVDGNEYIDYCMAFGPLILGHAHPRVVRAVQDQAEVGMLYGAPIEKEVRYSDLIRQYYPSIEMLRFVNSGTEATMHALRVARGYTGRKKVIKMEGAFHGAHDALLVKAGSGATTHCAPNSLGIPEEVTSNTLLAPYNDADAVRLLLSSNPGEVAALILEPVIGNAGPILPQKGYLEELREVTEENDVLLIFDEVITGFRLAMGGAQEFYGITPDMTILGKIAGGGLPIGIFGGSKEIMSTVSPVGKVYQAGTFSGNPMSLAAGMATVRALEKEGHEALGAKGEKMRTGLENSLKSHGLRFRVQGLGSMFQLFMTPNKIWNYQDALSSNTKLFMQLFHGLLDRGIYLPPSQFETNFLSLAHSDKDIKKTIEAFDDVLGEVYR